MPDYTLPYRTDWQDMASLLDYAKGSGADRAALDARFGAGEAMRETLNALDQLGLVVRDDSGGVRLTELGDRLAYAPDETQRLAVLVDAIFGYPPYRIPLERALADGADVVEAPWVEHVWQVDMRLGQPRNRVAEARTFFFRLAGAAGLGSYRRGVRGQSTRLELAADVASMVGGRLDRPSAAPEQDADSAGLEPAETAATHPAMFWREAAAGPATHPSIAITVDMTDWDLDRIEAFLRLIGYPIARE